jgi:hypothetical protein
MEIVLRFLESTYAYVCVRKHVNIIEHILKMTQNAEGVGVICGRFTPFSSNNKNK